MPESCALHLANSSVVRYAQLYSIPSTIEVCCNRGTSGIEGSLSPPAVGYAAASDKLNFIAIGDLSFFYDMNALWNINVRPNLRILLLNNGGGEIFHTLPGLDMSGTSHKFITAVHKTSAKGWAEERGFLYLRAENDEQLAEAMKPFTQPEAMEQPVLTGSVYQQKQRCTYVEELLSSIKTKIDYANTKESGQPSENTTIFFLITIMELPVSPSTVNAIGMHLPRLLLPK